MAILDFLRTNARWLGAGAVLSLLSSFGQTFFISIFAGEIRNSFNLSHGEWGGIYSLGTTASAVVMVWAGGLTDRYRVRVLGPAVLAGLACACVAMALTPAAWFLPVAVFLLRLFGQGMSSHAAVVAMSRWFVATRGRALAIATLGFSVGEAALPLIFVSLLSLFDWQLLWLVAAAIALGGAPALWVMLKSERTPAAIAAEQTGAGMDGRQWSRGDALRHPLFWLLVPAILGPSAFNTAFFFHQVHFAGLKDLSHLQLVAYFPLYTLASITAMVGFGWALDKLGAARLMPIYQLPMVVAFAAFSLATGSAGIIAGFVFLAVTTGGNSTLPNAFWAEMYGTRSIGSIKAAAAAVMVLGSAIGPGVTGFFIDRGIGLETQFLFVSLYFLGTSALMTVAIARYRDRLR